MEDEILFHQVEKCKVYYVTEENLVFFCISVNRSNKGVSMRFYYYLLCMFVLCNNWFYAGSSGCLKIHSDFCFRNRCCYEV